MQTFLVTGEEKTFRITVEDDVKVTFGPWSPPNSHGYREGKNTGTLRFYKCTKDNIVACFGGVISFRETSLNYAEQVAKEEGATIWKDDKAGYTREHKISVQKEWVNPQLEGVVVTTGIPKKKGKK